MPLPTNFGSAFSSPIAISSPAAVSSPVSANMTDTTEDDDTASTDDNDISSAENDADELSSSEDEDDDTSSAGEDDISSTENYGDDTSSFEGENEVLSTPGAYSDKPTSDNITTLRLNNRRPNISLELVKNSNVASKLPGFLAQMRAANQELEEEKSAGTLANRRIELNESESAAEGGQHIEMNLGLGVLEEKSYGTSTATESNSSNDEDDVDVMKKLLGGKRKRGQEAEDEVVSKKVKIQEV
jgi:hypothetical protein